MALTVFGIKNCDTVKKARAWLDTAEIAYDFHDFKTMGLSAAMVDGWIAALGWETVLNRAGTTFKRLPDDEKQGLDAARAAALMLAQPSMVKRPVLMGVHGGKTVLMVGFKPEIYAAALGVEGAS